MRLLLIEDDTYFADALVMGLQKQGYAVDLASDGQSGYELAQINSYDLLILDLNLPDVPGQERRAVFYKELSPLTGEQIREEVTRAATLFEEAVTPTALLDEHWNWLYLNRSGRLVFGLTGEEYSRLLGSHNLLHLVDVASPMYSRFPDEMRRIYFSWKIASFKFHFGEQEFCNWYRDVESAIAKVEWARRTWCNPLILSTLMDSHEVTLLHPTAGELHLRDQLNRHMRSARFSLLEWMPTDAVTALKAEALTSPEEWLQIEKAKGMVAYKWRLSCGPVVRRNKKEHYSSMTGAGHPA